LRESSILFALVLSTIILKERLSAWRIAAAVLILAGVAGLRMA
jgi:drug/metabolite transporter (DMT)-like permease